MITLKIITVDTDKLHAFSIDMNNQKIIENMNNKISKHANYRKKRKFAESAKVPEA